MDGGIRFALAHRATKSDVGNEALRFINIKLCITLSIEIAEMRQACDWNQQGWYNNIRRGLVKQFTSLVAGNTLARVFLAGILMLASSISTFGATKTWNKTAGGSWATAGNWTPSGAPAAGDAVIINSNQSANITAVPTISILSLNVSGTCRLVASASGNTMTVTGTLTVATGVTLSLGTSGGRMNFTLANTATGAVNGTGVLNFDGGTTVRTLLVNGNLTIAPAALITDLAASAGSAFTLGSGATLQIGSIDGITTTGAVGSIQVTGARTYNTGANYVYNGTAAQSTGSGLPATVNNLTINDATSVTLSQNVTSNGTLTLTTGVLSTGANMVIVSSSTPGAVSIASGSINGQIQRSIAAGSTSAYKFTDLNTTLTPNGSQGAITVSFKSFPNTTPPGIGSGTAVKRYYTVTSSGALTANVALAYLDAEINGINENVMTLFRNSGGAWSPVASAPNPSNNYVTASGVASFANMTIGDGDNPLPIQLVSFTGTLINSGNVLLEWLTLSEVNNYGFFVERKRPADQGYVGVLNSFVPGHGTTNEPHSYAFTDAAPGQGVWIYRLKQVDLDGTTHYTDPVTIDVPTSVNEPSAPIAFGLKQNYPNPFNPSTVIQYSVAVGEHVSLRIYDLLGREVSTLVDEIRTPGVYSVSWDASGLSAGIYLYRLEVATSMETKRLTLLK